MTDSRLLMISAMYENGGNVTHRFLDGHPEMFVYPFESQVGTSLVNDPLTTMFPVKYRWPVFDLAATPAQDFHAIIDEECRVRLRTPHVSKFRDAPMDLSDADRELLLSIELDYDSYIEPDHCGTCTACIEACPTQAIVAPYQLDARRCISYGTIELRDEKLPEDMESNLENWIFGCDICQDVCPWSRFSNRSEEERFEARTGIVTPALEELSGLSQEAFAERFRRSAIKRTKLRGLRRNARAALENQDIKHFS